MRFSKGISILVLCLGILALETHFVSIAWSQSQPQPQGESGAVLSAVSGRVTVNGRPASAGQRLKAGDVIVTETGRATLLMRRVGMLQIGPGSKLMIDQAMFRQKGEPSAVSVEVERGVTRALIRSTTRPDRPQFKVRSGTATMGVRGTEVLLSREQPADPPTFATVRGEAELTMGSERKIMRAGEGFRQGARGFEAVAISESFKQKLISQAGGETREIKSLQDFGKPPRERDERDRTPVDLSKLKKLKERLRDPARDGVPKVRIIGRSRKST